MDGWMCIAADVEKRGSSHDVWPLRDKHDTSVRSTVIG